MTLEEVLNEGWKIVIQDKINFLCKKEVQECVYWIEMAYDSNEHRLQMMKAYNMHSGGIHRETIYMGECKDLETFRFLCKLLGVLS